MEALWNLEDKWKLTTHEALLLFVCTALAVIGLCTATMLKRKAQRKQRVKHDSCNTDGSTSTWSEPGSNWVTIRRVLMGSVRWSGANKWEEKSVGSGREKPPLSPLLGLERCESSAGWQSHNSTSPVWQRPILMGEKCELPRFSGLILYDEKGRLLDRSLTSSRKEHNHQVIN